MGVEDMSEVWPWRNPCLAHRTDIRMGSMYPRSVRGCLPLWAVMLQAALILLVFFTSYDIPLMDQKFMRIYQGFQDFTIMAVLGLGFLNSSLRKHGWSSVAFNFFILVLAVQWAILTDNFFHGLFSGNVPTKLFRIYLVTISAVTVQISVGMVLGKANLVQLIVMTLLEVTVIGMVRMAVSKVLNMDDHQVDMMSFPVFAAYFGMAVTWCLSKPLPEGVKKRTQMATTPSLFGMLGTLFLWIFWPSFNSMAVSNSNEKRIAIFNTYFTLAVSAVTATSMSALAHPQGKINMVHTHNAVLAGGVAVSASSSLISSPGLAMVLGLLAGLISIGGAKCLGSSNCVQATQDFSGVHYTFGLPGLLGALAYIVQLLIPGPFTVGISVFFQVFGAFSFAVVVSLISGLLTGLLLKLNIWKPPHETRHFDDQTFWEFPHLAVGF